MKKVVVRLRGGLGNQLFSYCAARRLAHVSGAELVVDDVTGFVRDHRYRRKYMLDRFRVCARKATPQERLEPFERLRRQWLRLVERRKPFLDRSYVEEEGFDFDDRLLAFRVHESVYLDGLWQSEKYFKDIESIVRSELKLVHSAQLDGHHLAAEIGALDSVALHVRWFDAGTEAGSNNVSGDYYRKAIEQLMHQVPSAHFYLFSDAPDLALKKVAISGSRLTVVSPNGAATPDYVEFWLMTLCRHFIVANSTFSWWGAWLGNRPGKLVYVPKVTMRGRSAWGFKGLIPEPWIEIPV